MTAPGWALARRPASFRGVPFVVVSNQLKRGRQVALHVYPFRDDPWPEDMGRSPRVSSVSGFVVGDDADAQMQRLVAAAEAPGPGALVHPVLGSFDVQVLSFTCADEAERGRVWSFQMTVLPATKRIYPIGTANTPGATRGLFGSFGAAIAADFAKVQATIADVRGQVQGAIATVHSYVDPVVGVLHDASSLVHITGSVVGGNFGRFAGGSLIGGGGAGSLFTTVAQASGKISGAVNRVSSIGNGLSSLVSRL